MNSCDEVAATKLRLHSNKQIKDLVNWIESWPPSLRNSTGAKAQDRAKYRQQVSGGVVNLPTSQPSQCKPSTPIRNIRKRTSCDICGKRVESNSIAREKHSRTHLPATRKGAKES